ncbi:MAG: glycosyltransferase family 4 protein [Anaerolineae bacterium]|nr:glycosyltransferase family 4 protein [Anaerolineae bacterium]
MKARGLDVQSVSSPGPLADEFVRKYQIPFYAVSMTREITPHRDLVALFRLCLLLARLRPEIVHSHTPKGGLLGMIASWLTRVPIRIYQMHGLRYETVTGVKRNLLMQSERLACQLASVVICAGDSVRKTAAADGICTPQKMKVLGSGSVNGIDANSLFNPARLRQESDRRLRESHRIPSNALVIGFVGRIVKDKGLVELATAWRTLRKEFDNLHWLVVGPYEDHDPVPSDVRHVLDSDPRCHVVGYVEHDQLPMVLNSMDVLAFPSYREGLPITPLEAAAMGVPVVATRVTGCVDAVVDEVTGLLVPPRDSDALADALRTYLRDPVLRSKHGAAGRERVLADFQPERIWQALYQTYQSQLAEKLDRENLD